MRDMMARLKLTVNETKTRLCRLPEETFDFLGYTFGRCTRRGRDVPTLGTQPSRRRSQRLWREIHEMTSRQWLLDAGGDDGGAAQPQAAGLGELLLPRAGQPGLSGHRRTRLPSAPSVVGVRSTRYGVGGTPRFPETTCIEELGLVRLRDRRRRFS